MLRGHTVSRSQSASPRRRVREESGPLTIVPTGLDVNLPAGLRPCIRPSVERIEVARTALIGDIVEAMAIDRVASLDHPEAIAHARIRNLEEDVLGCPTALSDDRRAGLVTRGV